MKVLLWIIGIPLILLILAALLIPLFVDEEALVEIVADRLRDNSGIELTVGGDASLSLFPKVAIATSDVRITIPESGLEVRARSLAAGVALLPLLRSSVEVESIIVDGMTLISPAADEDAAKVAALDTTRLSRAELDAFYSARDAARRRASAEASANVLAAPLALEIGEISLTDIRVLTVDSAGKTISELQLRQLSARDLNTRGRPSTLSATVLIPSEAPADTVEIDLAGEITSDLNKGKIVIDGLSVKVTGATVEPLTVNTTGQIDLNTLVTNLELTLASGSLKGQGKVRYARFESPQIDADLTLSELNPALLVLAGPEAAAQTDAPDAGDVDTPLPLNALRMIDTRAQLQIDAVVLDAHRLEKVKTQLRAVDGVVTLKPVAATLHGGAIDFNVVLDAHYNEARLSSSGGVKDLNLEQAVAAAELPIDSTGTASLEWEITGTGNSSKALTKSLTGPIWFTTADITLRDVALQQMLCGGVALVNQEPLTAEFPTDTRFDELSAQIQLGDGVARLDPLTATLPAIALTGNGRLDLDSQDLAASLRAQLSSGLGEFDPACKINERYTDLRWPVECEGNLAGDPAKWCSVNTGEILKDLAEGEARRKLEKETSRFLKKLIN